MADAPRVVLHRASESDATLLANLLELYTHDLSDVFSGLEVGPDGRFGYRRLPQYWSEPDRRLAFIIRSDGRTAGFAFVTVEPSTEPGMLPSYDIAEFFVLRQYRRSRVGRDAAFALWNLLPGRWTVRVAVGNAGAGAFWRKVVHKFTSESAAETERRDEWATWRVFSFEST